MIQAMIRCSFVLAAIVLSGCVSSSDDEGSERANRGGYYDARITGYAFPEDLRQIRSRSQSCIDEPIYFESANERIRVYGSPQYSESTFERAAYEVERQLAGALEHFDLTWDEFVGYRPHITDDPEAILLCIDGSPRPDSFVEASLSGIAFPGYYQNWPYDYEQAIAFELIRFVQMNLSGDFSAYEVLPEWYANGQAYLWSGQKSVAHHEHEVLNPLESTDGAFDRREADAHSALAYDYLVKSNSEYLVTALIVESRLLVEQGVSRDEAFVKAFDRMGLVDQNGQWMSWNRYLNNYHQLLSMSY